MRFSFFPLAIAFMFTSCQNNESTNTGSAINEANLDSAQLVSRGAYLVNAVGCDDCHSPKIVGPQGFEIIEELRFSGYQANNPLKPVHKENLKNGWILFVNL